MGNFNKWLRLREAIPDPQELPNDTSQPPISAGQSAAAPQGFTKWELQLYYNGNWMYDGEYDNPQQAAQDGLSRIQEYPEDCLGFQVLVSDDDPNL